MSEKFIKSKYQLPFKTSENYNKWLLRVGETYLINQHIKKTLRQWDEFYENLNGKPRNRNYPEKVLIGALSEFIDDPINFRVDICSFPDGLTHKFGVLKENGLEIIDNDIRDCFMITRFNLGVNEEEQKQEYYLVSYSCEIFNSNLFDINLLALYQHDQVKLKFCDYDFDKMKKRQFMNKKDIKKGVDGILKIVTL